jgi:ribosomal protein S12 methylthiotransferase
MRDKSIPAVPPPAPDPVIQAVAGPTPDAAQNAAQNAAQKVTPEAAQEISGRRLRVGFVSLGCPKNLVDSEVMMGMLAASGAEITSRAEDADIIVVNTCSFIASAKQESVDTILEMARFKAKGRAKKLIVAGCLVERYRHEIRKNIPQVDAVVGTGELEQILAAAQIEAGAPPPDHPNKQSLPGTPIAGSPFKILNSGSASQSLKSGVSRQPSVRAEGEARERSGRFSRSQWGGADAELPTYLYDEKTPRLLATPKHAAYIKIAEGCDHPCGFCIIPQLRGKFRSRRFESVVKEAERLAGEGVREVTLIGQDTTCYGEDLGVTDGLAHLLERLGQIEPLRWVRFLYAYPNKISGRLLDAIALGEKICSYLDVPLQHASAAVLRRMKRGGSADIFLRALEKMRKRVPNLTLRTSLIAGFPGETEQEFEELCDFVREARFDWLGVFGYSDEEGTPAFQLGGKVAPREIERRRRHLMKIQKQISRRRRKAAVGQEFEVMLEGPSGETELLWEARGQMHAPEIDGKLFINDFGEHAQVKPGDFYRCRVVEAHDYDLVAGLI